MGAFIAIDKKVAYQMKHVFLEPPKFCQISDFRNSNKKSCTKLATGLLVGDCVINKVIAVKKEFSRTHQNIFSVIHPELKPARNESFLQL